MVYEENEEVDAWDEVVVGDDDRTLTLRGIHPGPWAQAPGTWWAFSRVEVKWTDEAVSVQLMSVERPAGYPQAMLEGDRSREETVVLDRPVAGRVVVDGCARLVQPRPAAGVPPERTAWDRIRRVDDRTLVVYWSGGTHFPLDHVSTEWGDGAVVLTVWIFGGGGRLSGSYDATIVRLDQPLGERQVLDGAGRNR